MPSKDLKLVLAISRDYYLTKKYSLTHKTVWDQHRVFDETLKVSLTYVTWLALPSNVMYVAQFLLTSWFSGD